MKWLEKLQTDPISRFVTMDMNMFWQNWNWENEHVDKTKQCYKTSSYVHQQNMKIIPIKSFPNYIHVLIGQQLKNLNLEQQKKREEINTCY